MHSLTRVRIGWAVSALPALFLGFDAAIKLIGIAPVAESFARLGYRPEVALAIGLIELVFLVIYLAPRTAAAGAILLTGFLGGAIATHLRVGDALLTHVFFPLYVALPLWGGLLLRKPTLGTAIFVKE